MVLTGLNRINCMVVRPQRKGVGINVVLQLCNGLVACLIFAGFFQEDLVGHPYLDWLSLMLGLVLCFQTHVALRLELRNTDPFVLMMVFLLIFFYELRISTLLLYPVQDVFERYPYGSSDTNYALLYILCANVFLYAGFSWIKLRNSTEIETKNYPCKNPHIGIMLFVAALLFRPLLQKLPEDIAFFPTLILDNFFTPENCLTVLTVYAVVFRKRFSSFYVKMVVGGGAIALLILQTLSFSRSGILTLVYNALIIILALLPTMKITRKYVLIGFALIPVLLVVAFELYAISTTSRMIKGGSEYVLTEKIALWQTSNAMLSHDPRTDLLIGQACSRAGFLDFSAEIIANSNQYVHLFSFETYFKSIVDNVLTVGFDVFDQPRISSSLKYVYGNLGVMSKKQEMLSGHSDQFGIYGEMYALFGVISLPILLFLAYGLKSIYRRTWTNVPMMLGLIRVSILKMFLLLMNSFGLDWILSDLITTFASYIIIYRIAFFINGSSRDVFHEKRLSYVK